MTALRRTAVLLGLIATVVIGSSIPASATFSASTTAQQARVSTLVVEPVSGIRVERNCPTTQATLRWNASPTAAVAANKVTSYAISANVGGQQITAQVPATQTYYVYPTGYVYPGTSVPVSITVTTQTQYGWTKAATTTTTVTTC
ncbi:hypothetical protein JKP75_04400 [Blastococcus sp. TML/M2B]|uniref:hypothetical protein n=1 Tax=unclassified Blastococcus TaxID=2619396 RepID=UPI00190B6277|nr:MULTISPECIES: hypothetical protein [unclassified Blastococcus]MBN1091878.1 hypothetical protein [Blastococcus sp. TML/M2B]